MRQRGLTWVTTLDVMKQAQALEKRPKGLAGVLAVRRARRTGREAEHAAALVKRLTELRSGLGLDEPEYQLLPGDPLCVALGVPRWMSADERREYVRKQLIKWIGRLKEDRQRNALRVAYNLHPDFHHTQQMKDNDERIGVKKRCEQYAETSAFLSSKTVERDADKAIEQLAEWFRHEPVAFGILASPLHNWFGIRAKRIRILANGQAVTVWTLWLYGLILLVPLLAFVIWLGSVMHWFYIGKF